MIPRLRARAVTHLGVIALLALAACGSQTGRRPPSRGPDCVVDVLPLPPGSGYVEVGELSFEAYAAGPATHQYRDPHVLAAALHDEICAVGGDTLVTERNAMGVIVRGTVFRHVNQLDLQSQPVPPLPQAEGCDPSCSPGSTCEDGTCVRQCVPACADGESCGSDAVCQPSH